MQDQSVILHKMLYLEDAREDANQWKKLTAELRMTQKHFNVDKTNDFEKCYNGI